MKRFPRFLLHGAAFVLLFFTLHSASFAQPKGTWRFSFYSGKIIKSTFLPAGYTHNEQVSNAVIAKALNNPIAPAGISIAKGKDNAVDFEVDGKKIALLAYFDSGAYKGFKFWLNKEEKIFGTGERSIPMNRRGYKLSLYNEPNYGYGINTERLNYSVPFIISSAGYGIFFDNPAKSYLDIGKTNNGVLEYGTSSGELTFYLIPGKNIDEILRKYHTLTGTQPIPARWVFGNLMSRFGYRSEAQLTDILHKMKTEHFPVDAVILDLFWFGDSIKGTMGNLDWVNKKAWPDPAKMIGNLKKEGVQTILITEPFVLNTTPNYDPSKTFHATDSMGKPFLLADFYFGNGGLLDIYRRDAQNWFWNKYKPQIDKGVAGWWGDLGEPERHPAEMYHNLKDLGFNRLFRADEVHNIYGHYWDKMLFDKYAKEYPAVRLFNLNRSGYAGSPRYGVFPWSGDVSRSWSGLQAQVPLMLGMSMSGVPYIHADAGGFAGGDGDAELYTRWIQFAAFTPVLRPHGTALGDLAPDAKDIPSEGALYSDPYKAAARKYVQLRYLLLPYNYTLAYEQAKYGRPLVRPLYYYSDADSNLYKAADQFMWGEALLIAPVLEKGITTRPVYLPQGAWYALSTEEKFNGAQWITATATLKDIPVFVKEGSFIPTFQSKNPIRNTADYTGKEIGIKYYPSPKKTSYTLFDDDGHTNNTLATGKYELVHFEGQAVGNKIRIHIRAGNNFTRMSRVLEIKLPQPFSILSATVNNVAVKQGAMASVIVPYTGKPCNVEITVK
jgi:oligosaccharide 4-alpha-D-glucosyltransferase